MPVLKHIKPTGNYYREKFLLKHFSATYSRILKKIGLDLNDAAKMSMSEIKPKVYGLKDEDTDAQFEFIEQQQQFW
jgi:hypothetical protein